MLLVVTIVQVLILNNVCDVLIGFGPILLMENVFAGGLNIKNQILMVYVPTVLLMDVPRVWLINHMFVISVKTN